MEGLGSSAKVKYGYKYSGVDGQGIDTLTINCDGYPICLIATSGYYQSVYMGYLYNSGNIIRSHNQSSELYINSITWGNTSISISINSTVSKFWYCIICT